MDIDSLKLTEALGLEKSPRLLSIVGGGGKSSLLFALGEQLPGRVLLTTTTRIFAAQMELSQRVLTLDHAEDWKKLTLEAGPTLVVGHVEGEKAVGVSSECPQLALEHDRADWVIAEADGSRMRPAKAPAEHEPVIPPETDHVVVVAGMDALSAPIEEMTHRPERVCAITGLALHETLTPQALGKLLSSAAGGLKNVPSGAEVSVLLNKVETDPQRAAAEAVAETVLKEERVGRVLAGQLKPDPMAPWRVWSRPV